MTMGARLIINPRPRKSGCVRVKVAPEKYDGLKVAKMLLVEERLVLNCKLKEVPA